jgi:hypothetical protein
MMQSCSDGLTAVNHLAYGLRGCPELRELRVSSARLGDVVFQRGDCPKLEVLLVDNPQFNKWDCEGPPESPRDGVLLMKALQAGALPSLRELHTEQGYLRRGFGVLVGALRAGAFRSLTCLALSNDRVSEEQLMSFVEALGAGACPELRKLVLNHVEVTTRVAVAITAAVEAGGLRRVVHLCLCFNRIGNAGVLALAEALRKRACPELATLDLVMTCLHDKDEVLEALARAKREGGLPCLENLHLDCHTINHASALDRDP